MFFLILIFSDLYTKISEVCNIDHNSGVFIVNEAFTFDFVYEIDLKAINVDIDLINYANKQLFGKVIVQISKF